MAAGICNEILMGRAMNADGAAAKLARLAVHGTDVRIAIILKLCECFSAIVLAVAFYGMTRGASHRLAVFGLACRVAEGLFIANLIPNDLGLLWLATAGPSATNSLAVFQLRPELSLGAVFFAVGSTVFSFLLLRARLVPGWLAAFGVVSSALLMIGLPLQLAGFFTGPLTKYQWVPATLFAPVLGFWLLIKGVSAEGQS